MNLITIYRDDYWISIIHLNFYFNMLLLGLKHPMNTPLISKVSTYEWY